MNTSEDLYDEYLTWTNSSLDQLKELLNSVKENHESSGDLASEIYGIAHNIKGMGTSFGFPLMTDLGTTLCNYLQNLPKDKPISIAILEAHLKAMTVILENKIDGDGGEMGESLKKRINEIVSSHSE